MNQPSLKHIAIAGNIGAGKTTLCTMLAGHFQWQAQLESVENNPYIEDFYHDMKQLGLSPANFLFTQPIYPDSKNMGGNENRNSRSNHLRRCPYLCQKSPKLFLHERTGLPELPGIVSLHDAFGKGA